MRFALMKMKAALSHILYNFEVQLCEETPIPLQVDPKALLYLPLGDVPLIFNPRDMNDPEPDIDQENNLNNDFGEEGQNYVNRGGDVIFFSQTKMFEFGSIIVTVIAVFITIPICLYLFLTRHFNFWKKRGVIYVRPLPFFGNLKDVLLQKKYIGYYLKDIYEENINKPYVGIFAFDQPALLVNDLEIVKNILVKDSRNFIDRMVKVDESLSPLNANAIFALRGQKWKHVRTSLTPTFTTGKMKNMFYLVDKCGQQLVLFIEKFAKAVWNIERWFRFVAMFTSNQLLELMAQIIRAFQERFNKAPPRKATLLDWERRAFGFDSVKYRPRSGRKKTREETCAGVAASIEQSPIESTRKRAAGTRYTEDNNARSHEGRSEKNPVAVKDAVERFTMDVIAMCAFGIECNSLQDPKAEFSNLLHRIFQLSFTSAVANLATFFAPWVQNFFRLKLMDSEIEDRIRDIVWRAVHLREKTGEKRNDLLDYLMELRTSETSKLDGDDFVAQAFAFLVAGFHTSSMTLTFALYELSVHQDIQTTARTEIKDVLEHHKKKVTYYSIKDMKYLDMVVNETLRKYPAIPFLDRRCQEDYPLTQDLMLPAGTGVYIPVYALHHDSKYFPSPAKFDPERFSEKNKQNIPHFAYMPFGEGPRNCIGTVFYLHQARFQQISSRAYKNYSQSGII
ncbi:hypothetical protein C0J52_24286 [Blattella germanica]|nr:hypothetical protein C0J52_24286 [Blattella germanica]